MLLNFFIVNEPNFYSTLSTYDTFSKYVNLIVIYGIVLIW